MRISLLFFLFIFSLGCLAQHDKSLNGSQKKKTFYGTVETYGGKLDNSIIYSVFTTENKDNLVYKYSSLTGHFRFQIQDTFKDSALFIIEAENYKTLEYKIPPKKIEEGGEILILKKMKPYIQGQDFIPGVWDIRHGKKSKWVGGLWIGVTIVAFALPHIIGNKKNGLSEAKNYADYRSKAEDTKITYDVRNVLSISIPVLHAIQVLTSGAVREKKNSGEKNKKKNK